VAALVLIFQNSNRLSNIYGVAVTGTFILNTILFLAVSRGLWQTSKWKLVMLGALFLTVETAFFSSNLAKVADGAYLPLAVGLVLASIMVTWRRGRDIVTRARTEEEGPLVDFLNELCDAKPPIVRLPGTAIFPNPGKATTPLALRAQVESNHALHEKVIIVSLDQVSVPHVSEADRFASEQLGRGLFKIIHLTIRVGYRDRSGIADGLALARKRGFLDRNLDLEHAFYFVSRMTIVPSSRPGMARWRKRLFIAMARNAASPVRHFGLPSDRTVITGYQVSM
jgi:KUP system potassium uptake protein